MKVPDHPAKTIELEQRIEELEAQMRVMLLRTSATYQKENPPKE